MHIMLIFLLISYLNSVWPCTYTKFYKNVCEFLLVSNFINVESAVMFQILELGMLILLIAIVHMTSC